MRRLLSVLMLGAAGLAACFEFGDPSSDDAATGPGVRRALIVTATGSGRIVSLDGRIDCTATNGAIAGACAAVYDSGTVVTLAAVGPNTDVADWGVSGCAAGPECQLTLHQHVTVDAALVAGETSRALRLQSPGSDGIILLRVSGPSILSIEPVAGLEFASTISTSGATTTARIILRGTIGSGTLATVRVRGIHATAPYTAEVEQAAAAASYTRRALTGYAITVE